MAKNYMLLYGKKSIQERLQCNPASIRKILLADDFKNPHIQKLIDSGGITVERLGLEKIENMKRAKNVQGIIAKVDNFLYSSFADLLLQGDKGNKLTLVFLDRINDPQNLGVIIRTLACLSGFGVVIPEKEACHITEAVIHVASGGENYVQVAKVPDLIEALSAAKKQGFYILGAVIDEKAKDINSLKLKFPLALVLGTETTGIALQIQEMLDVKSYIPMRGAKLSLNVNAACTIFCHEIAKQRLANSG